MTTKHILITGASSGIGRETAIHLAKKGHVVYGAARRLKRLEDLKQYGVIPVELDVTSEESMTTCVAEVQKKHQIDVLINNAGYGSYGALEDVPMPEARRQIDVNLLGLARMTQLVLPHMREQRSGTIINISSVGGRFGEPHGVWYHASKFAVEGLSDSLRMELKQFNVDVVVIQPGGIKTEWGDIATDNMMVASEDSPYAPLAKKHSEFVNKFFQKYASHPRVIAEVIAKAIEAKKPKTRYHAGAGARTSLWARKLLSDRMFDKMILAQL